MPRAVIWKHYTGYPEARESCKNQSREEDLGLIDGLHGRRELSVGASDADIKQEALRQLEIEFRSERDEDAEFHVNLNSMMKGTL